MKIEKDYLAQAWSNIEEKFDEPCRKSALNAFYQGVTLMMCMLMCDDETERNAVLASISTELDSALVEGMFSLTESSSPEAACSGADGSDDKIA